MRFDLDPDFLACTLEDVKDAIGVMAKSKAKRSSEREIVIWTPIRKITVLVRSERVGG